jgi:hypothetical protein
MNGRGALPSKRTAPFQVWCSGVGSQKAQEQADGFRGDLPLIWVRQVAPIFDVTPDLVDYRGRVVLPLFRREAVPGIKDKAGLVGVGTPFLRLWYRG